MKIKKGERGEVALNDYMIAIMIFMMSAAMVSYMYLKIYKLSSKIKIDEAVIGYITEICEQIDLKNYEDISTVGQVNEIINNTLENTPIEGLVQIECTDVEKFSEKYNVKDYVEKIHLNVKYKTINENARDFEVNKLKVKEINK